jgi:hypothetical protein
MVASATKVALDPVSDRYMIPVMLPLLTIIVLILDGALKKTEISPKAASIAAALFITAFITYSMTANAVTLKESVLKAESEGAGGFNTVYWKNHSFLSRLELLKGSDMIYSDNPGAIRFLTGKSVHYSPKKTGLPLYGYNAFLKESENYRKQYIVWFGNEISESIYTPREFKRDFTVAEVYRDDTISIYELERNRNEKAWLYP